MLTDEQKSFFMDMENLFHSPGWARLHKGWLSEIATLPEQAFFNAKNMEDMLADRVRMQLLRELVDLPATIQRMRADLEGPEAESDE